MPPTTLSTQQLDRAAAFLREQARTLDRRLFELHFDGGSSEAVIDALADYQNEDGGFGRCLEPDFRLQASSPLATSVAFQYLRQAGAPAEHLVVAAGIQYLFASYEPGLERWPAVPPEVNDVPSAPWWQYDEESEAAIEFRANPGAEIVGYLHAYAPLVPEVFLREATWSAMECLEELPDEMEMHDALCFLRMAENVPEPERGRVLEKLRRVVAVTIPRDPAAWDGYGATPLLFAPSPASPLAGCFGEELQADLDRFVARQGEDGAWAPNWSWGRFEDDWRRAEREWKGALTVAALKTLRDYGRLA
jgi:hypothetical protein